MPYHQGKFKPASSGHSAGGPSHAAGAVHTMGNKPAPSPQEKEHGPAQSPHGGSSVEHVTKTHPGKTQPHPQTGVHAFHAHHQGGGKYESHTHHDGGEVETRQHPNQPDMMGAMNEALPDEGMGGGEAPPEMEGMEQMAGIGGGQPETE